MNHLDALEAESIYILREAFAKLDKLAILWSLGKDSNVVLWLVRKAFFGHVPFPVMHVDTEKKFPEMYAFRDRYAQGVGAQLHPRAVPAGGGDRPDPAAGRPLGRAQDAGPEGRRRQARLQRPDPGHPPRRGGDPRQGALFQPARRGQQLEPQGPAAGVLGPVHDQLPGRDPRPRASAAALDRGRHLAATPSARTSRSSTSTSPRTASATARWATRTSPRRSPATAATLDEIIAELETTRVPERSGRAMDHESEDAFERLRAAGYM